MKRWWFAILLFGLAQGGDAVAQETERLIRISSNNKDLEVCLVHRFSLALDAVTISADLFRISPAPYVEVTSVCEAKKPIARDRYGQPIATLAIDACATTIDAFPGTAFWDGIAGAGEKAGRLRRYSRRLALITAAGDVSAICEKIAVNGGRNVVDWMLDLGS